MKFSATIWEGQYHFRSSIGWSSHYIFLEATGGVFCSIVEHICVFVKSYLTTANSIRLQIMRYLYRNQEFVRERERESERKRNERDFSNV